MAGILWRMSDQTQELLREALTLSDGERADLAAELLASLEEPAVEDDPATVREFWADEIEARAQRVVSGDSDGQDWHQVRERLGHELAEG